MEITLKDLWAVLKKSILFCLLGALLLGSAFYVYTSVAVQKVYRSTAEYVLVVEREAISEDKTFDETQLNNYLVVGGKSIKTLSSYLMNEKTMTQVLRYISDRHTLNPEDEKYILDYRYSASSVPFNFIVPDEETDVVFKVTCNAYSAKDAHILMDAFTAVINERSEKILLGVFSIDVSAEAKDGTLVSPSLMRNALLGAVLGAAIPYIVCLLYSIFDTRIKKEEDLKKSFSYPVLGQIPRI